VSFNLGSVSINLSSAPLLVAVNSSQKQRMMSRRRIYDVTPLQIITGIVNETEATLGPGSNAGDPADTSIPAPPWWLIGLGAFGVLGLFGDVMKAVFGK